MNPVLPPPRRSAARSEAAVATLSPEGADPPPEGANLTVTDASVSDESPSPGGSTTLTVTVRNMGGRVAPTTILRYYRSTDATITASDTQVGTNAVGALAAAGTSDESISLTASFTSGAYYYWACVDAVTAESDTTNNCSSSVGGPGRSLPHPPPVPQFLSVHLPERDPGGCGHLGDDPGRHGTAEHPLGTSALVPWLQHRGEPRLC